MKWYEKQKQLYDEKTKKETMQHHAESRIPETTGDEVKGEELMNDKENKQIDDMLQTSGYNTNTAPSTSETNKREVSILHAKTTIHGNMETSDDVIIYGTLVGDISCDGNLTVYGNIQGNVSCHNAIFKEARIEGDVECSGLLELSEKTIMHGNVAVVNLEDGGQIKGDVIVEETAHFKSTSAILGNVTALEIQVDKGCILQGMISITEKVDF